ncbi:MAG TPA: hypothetical protein VGC67_04495 [Cellulomonas sp.]
MFEFRAPGHGLPPTTDFPEISRLFDDGKALSDTFVEDVETGTRLTQSVGLGYGVDGGVYLFRWRARTMAVEYRKTSIPLEHAPEGGPTRISLLDLRSLGTTPYASVAHIKHDYIFPTQQEHDLALRTAVEAALVYESHMRSRVVDHVRIADPDSYQHDLTHASYLTLADLGYPARTERWDLLRRVFVPMPAPGTGGDDR